MSQRPTIRLATDTDRRKIPNRMTFTATSLAKLMPPAKGRLTVFDTRTPGLCVRVTPKGAASFYWYKWLDSGPCMYHLGSVTDVSIDAARAAATEHNAGALKPGYDPRTARDAARAEITVGELWDRWIAEHVKPKRRPRTVAEYERIGEAHVKAWRSRPASAIDFRAVDELHHSIGKDAPIMANRVSAILSSMFGWATKRRIIDSNPAKGIERYPEQSRERFLQPHEIPAFFKALEAEPNHDLRDVLKVLLFTGARRSTVESMRWQDVDIDNAMRWTIPEAKGGKTVTIPLPPPAVEVLKARLKTRTSSPYVFASYGKTGHVVELKVAWDRFRKRAGLPDIRLHDLRRTFGSWQAAAGVSSTIIGRSLGHAAGSPATAVYSRLNLDPVRQSVDAVTAALLAASKPKKNRKAKGGATK